jgi:hypothetical protein
MAIIQNPLGHVGSPPRVNGTPTTTPSAVRAATAAEAAAGTKTDCYISPATAQSATVLDFASPPAAGYGSGTARPVAATTITATSIALTAPTVAGASPVVNNSRAGIASFTDVIANGAYGTLTITNSAVTASSVILVTPSCTTVNSALVVAGIVPGSGTVAIRLLNAGAASTAANILLNYSVLN